MGSSRLLSASLCFFFFQAEDGIRDLTVTGVQTCALPILSSFQQLTVTIVAGQTARPMIALQPFGTVIDSMRSEEHTSELQSQSNLVCRLLLEKKKNNCLTVTLHCS